MSVYTLLEIVQDVHNDLNLDPINAIGDTPDSIRVAQIAKTTFYEFIARRDWPHLRELGRLNNSVDLTQKTALILPENVSRIEWIRYNTRRDTNPRDTYNYINYLYPDQFLQRVTDLDTTRPNVETVTTTSGASFFIRNDKWPEYWTSFDDNTIYFDSYDSEVEDTLIGNKTQVLMYRTPIWSSDPNSKPDLTVEAFPGYLAEVKSVASLKINEIQDGKSEQQAVRQQRRLSNQEWRAAGGIRKPGYGRVPSYTYSQYNFRKYRDQQ